MPNANTATTMPAPAHISALLASDIFSGLPRFVKNSIPIIIKNIIVMAIKTHQTTVTTVFIKVGMTMAAWVG